MDVDDASTGGTARRPIFLERDYLERHARKFTYADFLGFLAFHRRPHLVSSNGVAHDRGRTCSHKNNLRHERHAKNRRCAVNVFARSHTSVMHADADDAIRTSRPGAMKAADPFFCEFSKALG